MFTKHVLANMCVKADSNESQMMVMMMMMMMIIIIILIINYSNWNKLVRKYQKIKIFINCSNSNNDSHNGRSYGSNSNEGNNISLWFYLITGVLESFSVFAIPQEKIGKQTTKLKAKTEDNQKEPKTSFFLDKRENLQRKKKTVYLSNSFVE